MGGYPYSDNGRRFWIRFNNKNVRNGQFEIIDSETNPLQAANWTTWANISSPMGRNLFYNPIPFEMLRTVEEKPQLLVTVDSRPVVCHNMTCDFEYIRPVGEITAFSFDADTDRLILTGTDLPPVNETYTIEFAATFCTIDESVHSDTNVECILDRAPVCGDHLPLLTHHLGLVPLESTVAPQTVDCTLTEVNPSVELSLWGMDNLTISGANLPHDLEKNIVEIKFNDAQETLCVPKMTSTSEIICQTEVFDGEASVG